MNNDIKNKNNYNNNNYNNYNMDNIIAISLCEYNFLKSENFRLLRELNSTISKLNSTKRSKLRLKNLLNEKIESQAKELELKDKELELKNRDINKLCNNHYNEINKIVDEYKSKLDKSYDKSYDKLYDKLYEKSYEWAWDNIEKEDIEDN